MRTADSVWRRVSAVLINPFSSALIPLLLTAYNGVFASLFANQITLNSIVHWDMALRSTASYFLAAGIGASIIYARLTFVVQKNIMRFAGVEYRQAFVYAQCLPELAERYNRSVPASLAKSTRDLQELIRAISGD